MTEVEEKGYLAWNEFYTQMQRRFHKKWPKKQFWEHQYYNTFLGIAKKCLDARVEIKDYIGKVSPRV